MVRSVSGRTIRFPLPRDRGTYAAVVRRTELDAALVDLARCAGVDVREGSTVVAVERRGDGAVRVTTDGGDVVDADYLIGADGVWSAVRKLTGAGDEAGYLGEWHAFRQYRKASTDDSRDLWVMFEEDLRPGYAWSFPLADDIVNVGIGILRKPGEPTRDLGRRFREVMERPHIRRRARRPTSRNRRPRRGRSRRGSKRLRSTRSTAVSCSSATPPAPRIR